MSRPRERTVELQAYKYSRCYKCEKRIRRTHTFYASSFDAAHQMRAAWLRVTTEVCQSCSVR